MNEYGFDGFDIDWEFPEAADRENFLSLVQELRTAFNAEGKSWELTVAVSVVESLLQEAYNVPQLCQ
jgi:chitinase